ncbi:unnamed protein product [Moneuplotes crassus]|uniref:EF-hand domain-containing protein n=1 Tax=Euplotes crassus TaxID=5936 RepID=A0AAD1XVI2_EUPCR|nr:unnamed protein product [Moneuplotes crassus]
MAKNFVFPKITPYVPGDNDDDSQIISDSENEIVGQFDTSLLNQDLEVSEARFLPNELAMIKKEFDKLSKDQVIGKQKLFKFLRITDISETFLTDQLFYVMKNSPELNSPIDWQKFISFLSIFLKGSEEEKLKLIFLFFDRSRKYTITKEEMQVVISSTILSMMSIPYEDRSIESVRNNLLTQNESTIDAALNIVVDEIFSKYSSSGDELTFDEWCNWFKEMDGVSEILNYRTMTLIDG